MYKVLLVDDERIIREGIAALIDWEGHGFILTGAARNGIEACEMIERDIPQIIITDIKMPVLDGLGLIAKQKKLHPETVFIVLSGYGEFELAKEAMKYGVNHYLLKPCNENKIIEVLDDVRKELAEKESREEFVRRIKRDFEKVLPLVKEQFLRDFIMDREYTSFEMEYYCNLLNIQNAEMRLVLLQPEEDAFETMLALRNIINEQDDRGIICFCTILKTQVLILVKDINDEELIEFLNKVKDSFDFYKRKEITISFSDAVSFENTPVAYRETQECLKFSFYLGEGSIITKEDIEKNTGKQINDDMAYDYDKIAVAIKSGNIEVVTREMNSFFDRLKASKCPINITRTYCMELFMIIIRQCRQDEMDLYIGRSIELQRMDSFDRIREFIMETGVTLTKVNYDGIINRHSKLVRAAIKYIDENLDNEELTLKLLANEILYMNVGYLGKLFSKETGEKFSHYLMKVRMERAKDLLKEYEVDRVYEVAQKVGLGDNPQYFSQVFKKYTGFTPSEYKVNRASFDKKCM